MTSINFRTHVLLRQKLEDYLKPYFTFQGDINVNPLEFWLCIAHYKFAVGILMCLFTGVVSCWFATTPMQCILKYDRSEVPDFQEDICLSYPYAYSAPRDSHFIKREKVYALHYRWVHWVILILVPIYSSVLWLRKELDHKLIKRALKQLEDKSINRKQSIKFLVDQIVGYSTENLYFSKLLLHLYCLLVDIVVFSFLDVSLQNRFARLFPLDYPFTRWPQHFNDTLSLAFPPFVECNMGKEILLMLNMEDKLGCQLPLMIIYDKLFVIMWVCLVLFTLWSLISLIYCIALGMSKCLQRNLIKRNGCCKGDVNLCLKFLSIGDLMCLNSLSHLVSDREYREILKRVAECIHNCKRSSDFSLPDEIDMVT